MKIIKETNPDAFPKLVLQQPVQHWDKHYPELMYGKLWKDIAYFEKKEVNAWKNSNPIQQEARAQERMKAYVKLFYKVANIEG